MANCGMPDWLHQYTYPHCCTEQQGVVMQTEASTVVSTFEDKYYRTREKLIICGVVLFLVSSLSLFSMYTSPVTVKQKDKCSTPIDQGYYDHCRISCLHGQNGYGFSGNPVECRDMCVQALCEGEVTIGGTVEIRK